MKLKVKGQRLELDTETVAEGAVNYASFELCCDISWKNYVRTVRFQNAETVCDVPDVEDGRTYYIPSSVLKEGDVYVGVVGVSDEMHTVTTTKAVFRVEAALDCGRMPYVEPDAYAKYVRDVSLYKREAEQAEEISLECANQCRHMLTEVQRTLEAITAMSKKVEGMLYEASGMVDAVGTVYGNMKKTEGKLTDTDSALFTAEKHRDKNERARTFTENKRVLSECDRRERECERQIAESHRSSAEAVRNLNEVRREERLREFEEKLLQYETREALPVTCITETVEGDGELSLDGTATVESITVYGQTSVLNGRLSGIGEDGFINLYIDGEPTVIPIDRPLYSAGSICDELTVDADGNVSIIRRTDTFTVSGDASFVCDGGDNRLLFVTALTSSIPSGESNEGHSSSFSYGASNEGDCIWVNGDYVFMELDSKENPNIPTLAKRLTETPVTVVYPRMKALEEAAGSVHPITAPPQNVRFGTRLTVSCKKEIFTILDQINTRLKSLENPENKEEKE